MGGTTHRPAENGKRLFIIWKPQFTACEPGRSDDRCWNGSDYGKRHNVLLRANDGLRHPVHAAGSLNCAGDLRNHKRAEGHLGVFVRKTNEGARNLLGGSYSDIRNEVPVNRTRILAVDKFARKVSAVSEDDVEVRNVLAIVELRDRIGVLLRRGLKLKAIKLTVVGRAHELDPLSTWSGAVFFIWSDTSQMIPSILVAEFPLQRWSCRGRHLIEGLHRIEIRDQGNCHPVIAIDLVIAADHSAELALAARTQTGWRLGADVIEVDGGVAGRIQVSEEPKGFFQKKSRRSMHGETGKKHQQKRCYARDSPTFAHCVSHPLRLDAISLQEFRNRKRIIGLW